MKKLLSAQGPQWVGELLDLMAADNSGKQPGIGPGRLAQVAQARSLVEEILRREDCLSLKALAVKGGDLLDLGCPPRPLGGRDPPTAADQVLEGSLPNDREALLRRARSLLRKKLG